MGKTDRRENIFENYRSGRSCSRKVRDGRSADRVAYGRSAGKCQQDAEAAEEGTKRSGIAELAPTKATVQRTVRGSNCCGAMQRKGGAPVMAPSTQRHRTKNERSDEERHRRCKQCRRQHSDPEGERALVLHPHSTKEQISLFLASSSINPLILSRGWLVTPEDGLIDRSRWAAAMGRLWGIPKNAIFLLEEFFRARRRRQGAKSAPWPRLSLPRTSCGHVFLGRGLGGRCRDGRAGGSLR